jgi:phosphatidylserine synthase
MMIETNLMRGWAGIVESVALFALTILAIGLIVSAVKLSEVLKHLGTILGVAILLLMLPAIMVSAWSSMSYWQHLGIVILGIMVGLSLRALQQMRKKR